MGTKVIDPAREVWNPEVKVGNEETRKKQNVLILIFGPKKMLGGPVGEKDRYGREAVFKDLGFGVR